MSRHLFDFSDGDYFIKTSDNTGMDMDGHLMVRESDNMALDLETGELHITSGWKNDDNED